MEKNSISHGRMEAAVKDIESDQFFLWFFRFCIFLSTTLLVRGFRIAVPSDGDVLQVLSISILFGALILGFIGIRRGKADIKEREVIILQFLRQVELEQDEGELSKTARAYISYLKKKDAGRRKPRSAMLQAS